MYKIKTSQEFISDIRSVDPNLSALRLSGIEIDRKNCKIKYNFICNTSIDERLKDKILQEAEKITAPIFRSVEISVAKIVSDDQLINNEIYKYVKENYPSLSIFLKPTDINSSVFGDMVKYVIRVTEDGAEYVKAGGVLLKLNEYLATKFCSDFTGSTDIKEAEESINLLSEEVMECELQKIEHRTIRVKDMVVIDDLTMGDVAVYIEDVSSGANTVCGIITDVQEKMTKNGKPFLVIHIDDTTGKLSGVYFSKKNSYDRIRHLAVGDAIIARGSMGEYNDKPSFTFEKINRCTFPEDFKKNERYKKPVPREYKLITPTPANTIKINSVFDYNEKLPAELTEKEYVVFDVETTGTNVLNDGLTEIGAVRLKNGVPVEQFTSLIKPDSSIPERITEITGITEEMVKDAPKISSVMPDFIKFIDGAILVGHNVTFDLSFIRRFASAEDYEVKNRYLDTLELSRTYLPMLKKHDLHTVADHFGIVFHHHRALADSYATAEVFTELMKIKENSGK